ncbi:MAG TPA: HEAT repeat domain-containing protein, partial [Coriobacteriia bacterium]
EGLLGKRLIELLNGAALQAQWFQLGDVVARLAQEGDSRCVATIESLMRRPDAQARKEVVSGLAAAGGPIAAPLLGELVRDANPDVAIAAARELAKGGLPGAGAAISARLSQLDVDNADFELARELIEALARTPDAAAGETLAKLASRRSLIKRGHFTDVQVAVTAALRLRAREPVPR